MAARIFGSVIRRPNLAASRAQSFAVFLDLKLRMTIPLPCVVDSKFECSGGADAGLSVDLCRPARRCVYRVYVLDSSRDILRSFQLTIAEKEGLPAEERFNTRNHLVQFALGECASDAGPAGQVDEFRGQTNRAKQNWSLGRKLADLSGRIDSILAGHEEV